jgi:predicted enzyme related to lactoylglutathione lyase
MAIQKVQSVYSVVNNMDRAQKFYESALGLSLNFRDGERWCQFNVGNTNFALSAPAEAPVDAKASVVVFEAESLDGVRQQVEERGGKFLSTRDMGSHGTVVTFEDSEGNLFQVFAKAPKP